MNTLRRTALSVLTVLLTVPVAVLGLTLAAPSAQAVTYSSSGTPGTLAAYKIRGTTVNTCYPIDNCPTRQLQVPEGTVGRSPNGTTDQTVRVQVRIWKYNSSTAAWDLYKSVVKDNFIGQRTSTALPKLLWNVPAGYYKVRTDLWWMVTGTAVVLGQRGVSYTGGTSDYECVNSALPCSVGSGWIGLT